MSLCGNGKCFFGGFFLALIEQFAAICTLIISILTGFLTGRFNLSDQLTVVVSTGNCFRGSLRFKNFIFKSGGESLYPVAFAGRSCRNLADNGCRFCFDMRSIILADARSRACSVIICPHIGRSVPIMTGRGDCISYQLISASGAGIRSATVCKTGRILPDTLTEIVDGNRVAACYNGETGIQSAGIRQSDRITDILMHQRKCAIRIGSVLGTERNRHQNSGLAGILGCPVNKVTRVHNLAVQSLYGLLLIKDFANRVIKFAVFVQDRLKQLCIILQCNSCSCYSRRFLNFDTDRHDISGANGKRLLCKSSGGRDLHCQAKGSVFRGNNKVYREYGQNRR
ncbi:unknown [Clostridium sp. CAG:448]|nr:unknown [Clostridium sp. CAG:448]